MRGNVADDGGGTEAGCRDGWHGNRDKDRGPDVHTDDGPVVIAAAYGCVARKPAAGAEPAGALVWGPGEVMLSATRLAVFPFSSDGQFLHLRWRQKLLKRSKLRRGFGKPSSPKRNIGLLHGSLHLSLDLLALPSRAIICNPRPLLSE